MESETTAAIILAAINLVNVIVSALNRCRLMRLEKTIDVQIEKVNADNGKGAPAGG